MFSTLSRGTSRVRQTYICSACRCNILAHVNPQHVQPGNGATAASSHDFSTSAPLLRADEDEPNTVESSNGKPPNGETKISRRRTSRTPLSRSRSTLRALRESLLAEPIPPPSQQQKTPAEDPLTSKSSSRAKRKKSRKLTKSDPSADTLPLNTANVTADSSTVQEAAIAAQDDGGDGALSSRKKKPIKESKKQGRSKKGKDAQSSNNALAGTGPPDEAHAAVEVNVPADLSAEKNPGKPSKKEATKPSKEKKAASKLILPKISPKPKKSSKPKASSKQAAETKKTSMGAHTRSWTVIGEDGRKFTVKLDGDIQSPKKRKLPVQGRKSDITASAVGPLPAEAVSADHPGTKMTAKFFAENPTIHAKLNDVPSNAHPTVLQLRLKELLQADRLSETERLPALRKLILLRMQNRITPSVRHRLVKSPLVVRKIRPPLKVRRTKGRIGPGSVRAMQGTTAHEIKVVKASSLKLVPLDTGPLQVPQLSYGLERVLFNPGVYHLQDPRSRVYNFDPYLQTIMPVSEFDFNALKEYITSSRDKVLLSKAIAEKKKYTGSTSSMTSALAHFHFLLSQWREITVSNLSKMFPAEYNNFTAFQRAPVSIFLRWRDGAYAIDADKQYDSANILMSLGKSMEKLLTLSTEDFERYRKSNSDQITEEERNASEEFHYTGIGDFLLRSQLDAYDSRLPGTGMFDLKTRAVVSVRMDTDAYEDGRGYEIRGQHGAWESFEREYYDMIRSAFLKYSLQVRMGRMDGIFVAYHNTARIFGFQYISLPEMDFALHGTTDTTLGDREFKLSLNLLNRVLDRATAKYPKQSLRILIETTKSSPIRTYIFAEPYTEDAIETIQKSNKAKIEKFEKAVLGLVNKDCSEEDQVKEWEKIRANTEDSFGVGEAERESLSGTAETSDLNSASSTANDSRDLAENQDVLNADELSEDARVLADVVSATIAKGQVLVNEVDVSTDEEISEYGKDTQLADSFVGEDASATDLEEADEDEAASVDESVNAESENLDEDSEAEAVTETFDHDDLDGDEDIADERSPTISRCLSRPSSGADEEPVPREMIAMVLTIRNQVNGIDVIRPERLKSSDRWQVEHTLSELDDPQHIAELFQRVLHRRERVHLRTFDLNKDSFNNMFLQRIKDMNKKGRKWREQQSKLDEAQPLKVLNVKDGKNMPEKDFGLWTQQEEKGGKDQGQG